MGGRKEGTEVTVAERIWMKVWDVCRNRYCHHWVVTTYDEWFFGGFSKAWTTGSVSPVRQRDSNSPTVLQEFIAWMASSLQLYDKLIIFNVSSFFSSRTFLSTQNR